MKKISDDSDDLRPEYDFDFRRMLPNPYAERLKGKSVISVVLDHDVAQVFHSSEAVNELLRSVIKSMPQRSASSRQRKRRAS